MIFLEFIWIFSGRNHLKFNISHILNPNLNQKISIKSCSSRSFQEHQRHIPSAPKIFSYDLIEFSMKKSFNIQELLHCKVQRPWNQADGSLLLESFTKRPRMAIWSIPVQWISWVQNKTKQNKPPCFRDRWQRAQCVTHTLCYKMWEFSAI